MRLELALLIGDAAEAAVELTLSPRLDACDAHPEAPSHYHLTARRGAEMLLEAVPLAVPPTAECNLQASAAAELVQAALDSRPAPGPPPRMAPWIGAAIGPGLGFGGQLLGSSTTPELRARVAGETVARLAGWSAGVEISAEIGPWMIVRSGGRGARLARTEGRVAAVGGREVKVGASGLQLGTSVGVRRSWLRETASFQPNRADGTFGAAGMAPSVGLEGRLRVAGTALFVLVSLEGTLPVRLGTAPLYREPAVRAGLSFGTEIRLGGDHRPAVGR